MKSNPKKILIRNTMKERKKERKKEREKEREKKKRERENANVMWYIKKKLMGKQQKENIIKSTKKKKQLS